MDGVMITPSILQWARSRVGQSVPSLAGKIAVKPEKVSKWESGDALPSFNQVQKLASALHIPYGYFFLDEPPLEVLPIQDFRTVGDKPLRSISVELREIVNDVLRKRDWYHSYLKEVDAPSIDFVGRYNKLTADKIIIDDILSTFDLSIADRKHIKNNDDFIAQICKRLDKKGVWVMRSSLVKSNTHRRVEASDFRGFAICDDLCPIIYINNDDARAARVFTLIHELVHLWIGESGISNYALNARTDLECIAIERKCNSVAAEILAPLDYVKGRWSVRLSLRENSEIIAQELKVSSLVIARRALEAGIVGWDEFNSYYALLEVLWKRSDDDQGGFGDYYANLKNANGQAFVRAVVRSVMSDETLFLDGQRLLNTSSKAILTLAEEI
jgi:Zn-dependent peptidase ImmA (M78 family)/transcriptional regulator with XRE-family HTH domain